MAPCFLPVCVQAYVTELNKFVAQRKKRQEANNAKNVRNQRPPHLFDKLLSLLLGATSHLVLFLEPQELLQKKAEAEEAKAAKKSGGSKSGKSGSKSGKSSAGAALGIVCRSIDHRPP